MHIMALEIVTFIDPMHSSSHNRVVREFVITEKKMRKTIYRMIVFQLHTE